MGATSVGNLELDRLRGLDALRVLSLLAEHIKIDWDFWPTQATPTRRYFVNAVGADWELLIDGPRFYNTRTRRGDGGAIDLVMHLWPVPFKKSRCDAA
ncbi:TPA: hypothetical protein QDA97_001570 [Burkholderia vietnamiensis]|nr:hypothetical protein [Burkholderia vietnamiensis]